MPQPLRRYVLGVDVAKYQHQAVIWDSQTQGKVCRAFTINNTATGFASLLAVLKERQLSAKDLLAGLESTGHYGLHLQRLLDSQGYPVVMLNPIETQRLSRLSVRKIKNDAIDAERIAILANQKQRPTWTPPENIQRLRHLTRFAFRIVRQRTHLQEQLTNLLDRVCPEYVKHFPQLFTSKTALKVLEKWPDLSKLDKVEDKIFTEFLRKSSRGRQNEKRALALLTDIRGSIAKSYRSNELALEMKLLLTQYRLLERQLESLKQKAVKQASLHQAFEGLTALVGISDYLASVIIAEIGEVGRFPGPKALAAYAGLDPSVKQSGQYVRKQGNSVSKRGSKYLRRTLYFAGKIAVMHDDLFKAWYLIKRKQGKHYNVIMCALARKKLYQVYHTWLKAGSNEVK